MTGAHAHNWSPISGEMGRYRCSGCAATGWRSATGDIRVHRQPLVRPSPVTARGRTADGGRIWNGIREEWDGGAKENS